MYELDILQISAFLSIIPSVLLCYYLNNILFLCILLCNILCSLIVHRKIRKEKIDIFDKCDKISIFLWVLYNLYLVIKLSIFLKIKWDIIIFILLCLSLLEVSLCCYCNYKRIELGEWRSPERYTYHLFMHISGGLGTLFLLLAINRI